MPDTAVWQKQRNDPRRVENDRGEVRCRACLVFKPIDEMKWRRTRKGNPYPSTMCKKCHHRLYRDAIGQEAQERRNEYRRRHKRALGRALTKLANLHLEELKALMREELQGLNGDEVVDVMMVSEHVRRVYGTPEHIDGTEGGE